MSSQINVEHLNRPGEIRCQNFMATKNLDFIFSPGTLWQMREGQVASVPRWLIDKVLELKAGIPCKDKAAVREFQQDYADRVARFKQWACPACPKGKEREGQYHLRGSEEKYCKKCYDRLYKRDLAHRAVEIGSKTVSE